MIPSVLEPQQRQDTEGGLGAMILEQAADNSMTPSRGVGEGITGTGDALPDSTTSKAFGKGKGGKDLQ